MPTLGRAGGQALAKGQSDHWYQDRAMSRAASALCDSGGRLWVCHSPITSCGKIQAFGRCSERARGWLPLAIPLVRFLAAAGWGSLFYVPRN